MGVGCEKIHHLASCCQKQKKQKGESIMAKKVRLGVLGAGWWGTGNHLPILTKRAREKGDVEVVGVCRLGQKELKEVQETFGLEKATEDYREMFEWGLDGIVIATPHGIHYPQVMDSLNAGLHVMVEKPFVLSAKEAWQLVHLADSRNLHLMIPHGWHYFDFIEEAHNQISDGKVGKIEYVMCHTATPTRELFSGEGFKMDQFPAMFESDLSIYSTVAKGGGYSWGQMVHSIAMMLFVTGLTPVEVFAYVSTEGAKVEQVDMHEAVTVKFKEGAIGVISGSAGVPPLMKFQLEVNTYGSDGMLLLDVERERMELNRKDKNDLYFKIPKDGGEYHCEVPPHRFVELIKGDNVSNNSTGRTEAQVVSVIEAYLRSGKTGKPETVQYY